MSVGECRERRLDLAMGTKWVGQAGQAGDLGQSQVLLVTQPQQQPLLGRQLRQGCRQAVAFLLRLREVRRVPAAASSSCSASSARSSVERAAAQPGGRHARAELPALLRRQQSKQPRIDLRQLLLGQVGKRASSARRHSARRMPRTYI